MNKPDIIEIITREGIRLGRNNTAICPFHDDRVPSFKVYPDTQTFYCFGCGKKGDVVSFVQEHNGMSFKDALNYLGIGARLAPRARTEEREARYRKELRRRYQEELGKLIRDLSDQLRRLYNLVESREDYDITDFTRDVWAMEIQNIPHIEYKLDVLINGSTEDKFNLYKDKVNG